MTNKTAIRRIATDDPGFKKDLIGILDRDMLTAESITSTVSDILKNVRERGDEALIEYTKTFDKFAVNSIDDLVVSREQMDQALASISDNQRKALSEAAFAIIMRNKNRVLGNTKSLTVLCMGKK
jgi:histidinol dehydrogenase